MNDSGRSSGADGMMQALRLRVSALAESLRGSLWFVPTLMIVAASTVAIYLIGLESQIPEESVLYLFLPRTVEGARAVLQVVVGSVITVTSVVFSLTLVALQVAASNYSPRILRTFLRDRGTQFVLGIFLATFAYSFLVLQNTRAVGEGPADWAPQIAVVLQPVVVLGTLAALVFFIHHVTQGIRVETILSEILEETLETVDRVHGSQSRGRVAVVDLETQVPPQAHPVSVAESGFVQNISPDVVLPSLEEQGAIAVIRVGVGDHVVAGTTMAWVWPENEDSQLDLDILESRLSDAVQLGHERTMQQDVAFGIRQLVDVAVRALSPGVNDPNTAVAVIAHLGVVYCALAGSRVGHTFYADRTGHERLLVPRLNLTDYLHVATQQIGHYGHDAMVLERVLVMLTEVKSVSNNDHDVIDGHINRIVDEAREGGLLPVDVARVEEAARRAMEVKLPMHTTRSG